MKTTSFSSLYVDYLPDTSYFCKGTVGDLNAISGYPSYSWSTGETTQSINVSNEGKYWTVINNGSCEYTDTTYAKFVDLTGVSLGKDIATCQGTPVKLDAGNYPEAEFYWNGASFKGTRYFNPGSSNQYTVRVKVGVCEQKDTINVKFAQKPILNLGKDTLICQSAPLVLNAKNPGANYLWSTNAIEQTISVNTSGRYSVKVYYDTACAAVDTIKVSTTDCGKLSGIVFEDVNSDCSIGANEVGIKNFILKAVSQTSNVTFYSSTDSDGQYVFNIPNDKYVVQPVLTSYDKVVCPASKNYLVTISPTTANDSKNFGIMKYGTFHDLTASVQHLGLTRLSAVNNYQINYSYQGSGNGVSAQLVFVKDPFVQFISASNDSYVIKGDSLIWNLVLNDKESGSIKVEYNTAINFSLVGKNICSRVAINSTVPDNVISNNNDESCYILSYPYDPNCILVNPKGVSENGFIKPTDTLLTYTIFFQNTGNDDAYDVIVVDTLPVEVDPASFKLLGTSHSCEYLISGKGVVTFTHKNIMLPDSTTDLKGSIGFVKYSVILDKNLAIGTAIRNKASIYFDLAPAVVTNTALNTINDELYSQSIQFLPINNVRYDDPLIALSSSSSQKLDVSYAYSGPVKLVDNKFLIIGTGTVIVEAFQNGNDTVEAAVSKWQKFEILKAHQSISFETILDRPLDGNPFKINAVGGKSNNPIQFSIVSGNATVVGDEITINGIGEIVVAAYQPGNENYEEAEMVYQTFKVLQTTGLSNLTNEKIGFSLFPNPTKDKVSVVTNSSLTGVNISIENSIGEKVYSGVLENQILIDTQLFRSGVYIVKIQYDEKVSIQKLIIE